VKESIAQAAGFVEQRGSAVAVKPLANAPEATDGPGNAKLR